MRIKLSYPILDFLLNHQVCAFEFWSLVFICDLKFVISGKEFCKIYSHENTLVITMIWPPYEFPFQSR